MPLLPSRAQLDTPKIFRTFYLLPTLLSPFLDAYDSGLLPLFFLNLSTYHWANSLQYQVLHPSHTSSNFVKVVWLLSFFQKASFSCWTSLKEESACKILKKRLHVKSIRIQTLLQSLENIHSASKKATASGTLFLPPLPNPLLCFPSFPLWCLFTSLHSSGKGSWVENLVHILQLFHHSYHFLSLQVYSRPHHGLLVSSALTLGLAFCRSLLPPPLPPPSSFKASHHHGLWHSSDIVFFC